MSFLLTHCTFQTFTEDHVASCTPFDCGHGDLNEFFYKDCINYMHELLGKTYCFTLNEDPKIIVCAFTISNDSIKAHYLPNSRKKKVTEDIPREKRMRSYPAVLIGRLGIHKDYQGKGVGSELMQFIQSWFVDGGNKTGCRYIVVDSYNEDRPLKYYNDNGFTFMFSTEEQEKEYTDQQHIEGKLPTRTMYFDLIKIYSPA